MPEGRVRDADSLKMKLTHQMIQEKHPEYGKEGRVFTLKVVDEKVLFVGPKGGLTNPLLSDGKTLNPQFLKLKTVQKILGPTRDELIRQKEAIGQKLGSLLPGPIGSIVSFIFKAAGQVFSFLGEHAWLLILSVVAFFMERLLKKKRKQ